MKKSTFLKAASLLFLLTLAVSVFSVSCKKNESPESSEPEPYVSMNTSVWFADETTYASGLNTTAYPKTVDMELGKTYYAVIDLTFTQYHLGDYSATVNINIDISPSSVVYATVEETTLSLTQENIILDSCTLLLSAKVSDEAHQKKYRCVVALTPLEVGEATVEINASIDKFSLSGVMNSKSTVKVIDSVSLPSPLEYQLSSDGTYYSVVGLGQVQGGIITVPATYEGIPVKEIGEKAFYGYPALKKLTLPEGLTRIGARAFEGCQRLYHMNFPSTLSEVDATAFSGIKLRSATTGVDGIRYLPKDTVISLTVSGSGNISSDALNGFNALRVFTALDGGLTADEGALSELNIVIANVHTSFIDSLPKDTVGFLNVKAGTEIAENVGTDFTSLLQLSLHDGITAVGDNAFSGCKKLQKVIYRRGLALAEEVFGYDALYLDRLSVVRKGEFVYKSVKSGLGDNTKTEYLLAYVGESGHAVIPSDSTYIMEYAFYGNKILKSVLISKGITVIGNYAFSESAIETVKFDAGCKVSDLLCAFYNCHSLKNFEVPAGVTDITGRSLYGSDNVEVLTVSPGNATLRAEGNCVIEKSTGTIVLGCKGSVIPTSADVTSIAADAFRQINLTSVFIPANVTNIYPRAFMQCSLIESIEVDADNPVYISQGNCLINKDTGVLITGCKNSVIPTDIGVTEIASYAFSGCDIISVAIPEGVKKIMSGAFSACSLLESVTLPSTLTYIGDDAFSGNKKLTEIKIPKSVTFIGNYAFLSCDNLTVYLQKGINQKGWNEYWAKKIAVPNGSHHSPKTYE